MGLPCRERCQTCIHLNTPVVQDPCYGCMNYNMAGYQRRPMTNTEKRTKIAEIDKRCDGYCSPDIISEYSEQEIGEFLPIDEVRKLQEVNSAIRYMQNIWGGEHDTYTKVLVDYIEELEAKIERNSNQDT